MRDKILCGIDCISEYSDLLKGKRIGLITNPTGVNHQLTPTVDILNSQFDLVCLMAPEHGVRGNLQAGDHVSSDIDKKTGLPVHSLYGDNCHIHKDVLDSIDVVVFDIQDVGARFYTYLYTLAYAMEDCAKSNKPVIVLDRPNPISCSKPIGSILNSQFKSFVGRFPIATGYGLTIGEYAQLINKEYNIDVALHIVKLTGYSRDIYYDETDLVWIAPSPNLPTIDSCICYIGTCLFEGTNLSEGRGTTRPFEIFGAPWLDTPRIIFEITKYNLEGFVLRETYFMPTFSKHKGENCNGIQIHITDRNKFEPFKLGVLLVDTIRKNHKEFEFTGKQKKSSNYFIDLLLGCDSIRKDDFDSEKFFQKQEILLKAYTEKIRQYKIYK